MIKSTARRANRSSAPGVAARASSISCSCAYSRASLSRSQTTSKWSDTNPIGATATDRIPRSFSAAR
ncbi:Uncharacterised protein [Mycobacteroides abscessus subsp. abscessus]|nr:Uncharacterised protein [Mycobacteroides abscessus subsp. abscessus]